jgi:hypothetical protein
MRNSVGFFACNGSSRDGSQITKYGCRNSERHPVQRLRGAEPLAQSVNLDSRVQVSSARWQAGPAWGSG